jgi:hypothetical protein
MTSSRQLPRVGGLEKVLRRWMVAFGDQRPDLLKLSELILEGHEYHVAASMVAKKGSSPDKKAKSDS